MLTFWVAVGIVLFLCLCAWLYWLGYRSPKAIEHLRHSQRYPLGYSDDPNGDASLMRALLFPPIGLFFLVTGAAITAVRLVRGTLWQDRAAPERPSRGGDSERPGLLRRMYGTRL